MTTTAVFGWGTRYLGTMPTTETDLALAERLAVQQTLALRLLPGAARQKAGQ